MAVRNISTTDTLDRFRVQFNELAADDFGDIATLDPTLTATSVIGAVNELSAQVSANLGIFIEDSSSSRQQIGAGQTINFRGTANQLDFVVSSGDQATISLTNDVTIPNDLTVTNDLSVNADTTLTNGAIFGNSSVDGMTIVKGSITDSTGAISFGNENLTTTGTLNAGITTVSSLASTGQITGTTIIGSGALQGTQLTVTSGAVIFEGTTQDNNETTLRVADPTADRTVTIPDVTGTLITSGDTGTVTSTMILNGTIQNGDIADASIRAAKLNLASDTLVVDTLSANTITGTASVAQLVDLSGANNANASYFLTFADGQTGNQSLETDPDLNYNPSTNVLSTTATQARYADLAEYYTSDVDYAPGVIVQFGGDAEVTIATENSFRVAGVISTNPAFAMNGGLQTSHEGIVVPIALQGRVPCKVKGEIRKGDMIVCGGNGVGVANNNPNTGTVIGKALENYNSESEGTIEVVVGRL